MIEIACCINAEISLIGEEFLAGKINCTLQGAKARSKNAIEAG